MIAALHLLASAAGKAPSGDNTQPWRFEIDETAGCLTVVMDDSRDRSPMNIGSRMSRIACGAAAENIFRCAAVNQLNVRQVKTGDRSWTVELKGRSELCLEADSINNRVTNRRIYDGHAVATSTMNAIRACCLEGPSTRTIFINETDRLRAFGKLEKESFECMYGAKLFRQAIKANIRFDLPSRERVTEGLSTASLELNQLKQAAFRAISGMPDWTLRTTGLIKAMSAHVRRQILSSSGVCVILAKDEHPNTDFLVGRAMQRAWLALTDHKIVAQPMTAFAVIHNVLLTNDQHLQAQLGAERARAAIQQWPTIIPDLSGFRPAFALRYGYAAAPSGRSGRLPLNTVLNTQTLQPVSCE
jgi:hypothetical protein